MNSPVLRTSCLTAILALSLGGFVLAAEPPANVPAAPENTARGAVYATPPAASPVPAENAPRPMSDSEFVWAQVRGSGWPAWLVLGCSLVGFTIFLERFLALRRSRHIPSGFDKDVVHAVSTRGVDAGATLCVQKPSSLARVLHAGLLSYGASRQEMEAAIASEDRRLLYDLRRNGRWIGLLSGLAPLCGLIGTLLALLRIAAGEASRESGVLTDWPAELCASTAPLALSLTVAVPLILFHYWVRMRADDLVREIEERAVDTMLTLARKARLSRRLAADMDEDLETKSLTVAKDRGGLDDQFEDLDGDRGVKTNVTTPAQVPAVPPPAAPPPGPAPRRDDAPPAKKG